MVRAFIFTLDAFIVLPLVILIISAFVSFSVTLREKTLLHENTYLIARNTMIYLSELTAQEAGAVDSGTATMAESNMSILSLTAKYLALKDFSKANDIIERYLSVPQSAGFSFEWFNGTSWVTLQSREKAGYSFQVSDVRVVTPVETPVIQNLQGKCPGLIACQIPQTLYTEGKIYSSVAMRLRVFV